MDVLRDGAKNAPPQDERCASQGGDDRGTVRPEEARSLRRLEGRTMQAKMNPDPGIHINLVNCHFCLLILASVAVGCTTPNEITNFNA